MRIYNSLSRKVEDFEPINPPNVGMYACGMTVYDYAHIGHGRKYVTDDLLKRVLKLNNFKVKHVQNVTDVGHLVSDSDEGEDKLEKGAKKHGQTVWEVAEYFTKNFYESMDKLNITRPDIICKATEHIPEQIEMVKKLVEKGFAYDTPEAVYFNISKFPDYGQLLGQKLEDKKVAVRDTVNEGEHKKSPQDFALWFKRVGRFADHTMHWESPWGDGFPGWHIECSAMSTKYLGEQFDIHTGGEDHLSIHHPNEIAQSEAASGKKPFVKYWVHTTFLMVDGKKMSKSLGNFYTVEDVVNKGYDPVSLRYLYLTTHYRKQMNFTWDALDSAQTALVRLREIVSTLKGGSDRNVLSEEKLSKVEEFRGKFNQAVNNDLNMPEALAVVWEVVKSNVPSGDKYDLLLFFDEILGLDIAKSPTELKIPNEVALLIQEREKAREEHDFAKADKLRKEIDSLGFTVKDTPSGVQILPNAKSKK